MLAIAPYDPFCLDALSKDFLGLGTIYPTQHGPKRRVFLDSAASCLMMGSAHRAQAQFLGHYANTHSEQYAAASVSSQAYAWSKHKVLEFLGLDPAHYACVFAGSGATAAIQLFAQISASTRKDRDHVLISGMEHHSNDLPHRATHAQYHHVPLSDEQDRAGTLNLEALAQQLQELGPKVDYVAVTAASNVTGVRNDLASISKLTTAHGTRLLIDAAQALAHVDLAAQLDGLHFDALVFSGHKVYAPGSPGVLVIRKEILDHAPLPALGGGVVDQVYLDDHSVSPELVARFEPGTPNIVGAVTLGFALQALSWVGMHKVQAHEQELLQKLVQELGTLPFVEIYGAQDLAKVPRVGTLSFNLKGIPHAVVARELSRRYAVEVRNQCFCAQPYVRSLLQESLWERLDADVENLQEHLGMVRVSMGLYNTADDVDKLVEGLREIWLHRHELVHLPLEAHHARSFFSPDEALMQVWDRRQSCTL